MGGLFLQEKVSDMGSAAASQASEALLGRSITGQPAPKVIKNFQGSAKAAKLLAAFDS